MPPVKHKKNKPETSKRKKRRAPKAATAPTALTISPAIPSRADFSPPSESASSVPRVPSPASASTPMEVADQLHSAAIHLLRRLRVRDRETNVGPAQLSALSVLVFGGPKSLGELADTEQVRPPTMSRIVSGLQGAGLVRRHATADGRRVRLEASPKGVSLMWEARKRRVESLANAVAGLPESEWQQLRETLTVFQKVIRNL